MTRAEQEGPMDSPRTPGWEPHNDSCDCHTGICMDCGCTNESPGVSRPPINGVWVVSSAHDLTPEIVENVKESLKQAAAEGHQVVVVEGIEFRWRVVEVESSPDVQRLAQAARAAGRLMNVPLLANPATWQDFAETIAAEYLRLQSTDPSLSPEVGESEGEDARA